LGTRYKQQTPPCAGFVVFCVWQGVRGAYSKPLPNTCTVRPP
jgi:hypothetical protein